MYVCAVGAVCLSSNLFQTLVRPPTDKFSPLSLIRSSVVKRSCSRRCRLEKSPSYIFTFVDYCGQQLGEPKIRSFFCVFFLSPVLSIGREISVVECIKIFTELSRVAANGRSEKEGKPQPGKNIKRKKQLKRGRTKGGGGGG